MVTMECDGALRLAYQGWANRTASPSPDTMMLPFVNWAVRHPIPPTPRHTACCLI